MTIRQLAKKLGLSKSTVGYALVGSPMVSQTTQAFVQEKALELGYQSNPVASAFLRQVRSRQSGVKANLAMLIPNGADWIYACNLPGGAQERARELGYGLEIVHTAGYAAARLTKLLQARGVLGVIFSPLANVRGRVSLDLSKFACAAFGYSLLRPQLHRVVNNHVEGIRTAVRMLKREGYRRIGLVLADDSDARSNHLWACGFLGMQKTLPPARRVEPLLGPACRLTPTAIRGWLVREKPDAVIFHVCSNVPKIPEFAPGGIPWVVLNRDARDQVAGIDQQFSYCGRLLVDVVSAQIMHNERGIPSKPIVSMVNGRWVDHPSISRQKSSTRQRT